MLLLAASLIVILHPPAVVQAAPSNPSVDFPWNVTNSGTNWWSVTTLQQVQDAFNAARTFENNDANTSGQAYVPMPMMNLTGAFTLAQWQALSAGERALWLLNDERVARDLLPYEGVNSAVTTVAQDYTQWLLDNNQFDHNLTGLLGGRLDAQGLTGQYSSSGENLAVHGTAVDFPVALAVYNWNYDDSSSAWGHRENDLNDSLVNNTGSAGSEGLIGIGLGTKLTGYSFPGCGSCPWEPAMIVTFDWIDPSVEINNCTAPTAPTAVNISRTGNNVALTWSGGTASLYERWHAVNNPYFTPGSSCTGNCAANATSGQNTGLASTPGTNYFYQVVAANSCNVKATATKRVGDFSFAITPGTAPPSSDLFSDNMENGSSKWIVSHALGTDDWGLGTANPHSPTHAWFGNDVGNLSDQFLTMATAVTPSSSSVLTFWHQYNLESGYDGGVVEISLNGGTTWTNLESQITLGNYDASISTGFNSPIGGQQAFTGTSSGQKETKIALGSFSGSSVLIRFRLATDDFNEGDGWDGWYIDDVTISQ
ncbi:MAG: immune inhibitor A [Ardenticatenaceae bacterium]|nr:immune inhibitor A [Ardenticatenaceae bacterium]